MLIALILLAAGLFILIKGADFLVEGASDLARRIGITELAIGLTIVAFGTSLPELTVNIFSSLSGANDLAIGNVVGSNISNILLILGVTATIAPLTVQRSTVWKEIPFSLLAAGVLFVMANDTWIDKYPLSELSRTDGLAFLGFFLIFLWYTFGMQRYENGNGHEEAKRSTPFAIGLMILGLIMLVAGGRMAVMGATQIAEFLGLSQALIGLTVVAIGTSLPELATSIVAARKGKADLAVGNVVGSNIFNIFWILGISASIKPLNFVPARSIDIAMIILATIILFFAVHNGQLQRRLFLFWKQGDHHIIERQEGIFFLIAYAAYTGYLFWVG